MAAVSRTNDDQVVAVYIAGEAGGALTQTAIADKLGRIRFMQLMCCIVTVGTIIQTASINMGMFLAGRALAGYAVGYILHCTTVHPRFTDNIQRDGRNCTNLPFRDLSPSTPRIDRRYIRLWHLLWHHDE